MLKREKEREKTILNMGSRGEESSIIKSDIPVGALPPLSAYYGVRKRDNQNLSKKKKKKKKKNKAKERKGKQNKTKQNKTNKPPLALPDPY